MSDYMDAVAAVAELAGANALGYFRTQVETVTKSDGSPVTIADRTSEQLARQWVEKKFPGDGILGEEFGSIRPDAARRWIIDPIDGTKSFIKGVPLWGTLVAVIDGPDVIAGAAAFPALSEVLVAAPGRGCFWNGEKCQVSSVADLGAATVLATDVAFKHYPDKLQRWQALSSEANVSRTWGDAYGYLLVATGRAEVMVDPVVSVWDIAALVPAIIEAGGKFTDWKGDTDVTSRDAIATNSLLADQVRNLLGATRGAA